ncbi:MAG: DUF2723 domain-containing protein [Chloroflexi bacterium]|nr:DUF2723 domain-containing protein [Chloroflexota bacterium]MDA8188446.1 glycosyltransferase family 39 protein [Dehalococcoidales bacterium]
MWEKTRLGVDGKIAALLVCLVTVTRLPFLTRMLYNWDSANFALALRHFDVTRHQPHPPGYFYYVNLGRLFDVFLGDANASFVAESVLFSILAVVAVYYLGRAMFDRPTGFIAALFLAFSVTFWSYGTIALPYVSLAFFSAAAAFFAYGVIFQKRDYIVPLSAVYAIGGGFRPDLLLFLAPLWLASVWRQFRDLSVVDTKARRRRFGQGLAAVFVVAFGFLLWFVPTIWLSGGLMAYIAVFTAYTNVDVMQKYSVMQNGLSALYVNVRDTLSYLFYGLYATSGALALGVVLKAARRGSWLTPRGVFIAGWVAPMALFYTWVHVGDPGYVFTILPAMVILAARSALMLGGATNRAPALGAITVLILAANILIFSFYPRLLTLQGIRQNDNAIASKIAYIKGHYPPGSVLLVSYDLYRHLVYYLPQYDSLWLDVYARGERETALPPGVERIVLVDERLKALSPTAQEVDLPYGKLFTLPAKPGDRVLYGGDHIVNK